MKYKMNKEEAAVYWAMWSALETLVYSMTGMDTENGWVASEEEDFIEILDEPYNEDSDENGEQGDTYGS